MHDDDAPTATPLDGEIGQLETKLRELRRTRRSLRLSEAARKAWSDPEAREKRRAALASPEARARLSEAQRKALAKKGLALPPLSKAQRKIYIRLRAIVGREAALAEAQCSCAHCGARLTREHRCPDCDSERETPVQPQEQVAA